MCDARQCYSDTNAQHCADSIRAATAVLIATPVYNFDVSASAKNLVELTGQAWNDKVVGFLAAAGGSGSYMSVMGLANSLILDFRAIIIPRFVFATEEAFGDDQIRDADICQRTNELAAEAVRLGQAVASSMRAERDTESG